MHSRSWPKTHRFSYNYFVFYIDLDEVEELSNKIWSISHNRFNVFDFRDNDHLRLLERQCTVKEEILEFCNANEVNKATIQKVMLLTNLRTLGYQFNPVSFYYCFDANNRPVCSVAEIGNTFGEMKLFFLGKDSINSNSFDKTSKKHFYVSPFMDMDTDFHFNLSVPDEKLNIRIDDYRNGKRIFNSSLLGEREPLNNWNVIKNFLKTPLVTLQVIFQIHWQALLLWLKKIPYYEKASHTELQKQVLNPHKSLIR